jgi:hypothetical protein
MMRRACLGSVIDIMGLEWGSATNVATLVSIK